MFKKHISSHASGDIMNGNEEEAIHVCRCSLLTYQLGRMACEDRTSSGLQASNLGLQRKFQDHSETIVLLNCKIN